ECVTFRDHGGGLHLALVHGQWGAGDVVPVRVHEPFTALDMLDTASTGHSWALPQALAALRAGPFGVAVLLNCGGGIEALLPQVTSAETADLRRRNTQMDLRTYGIGAQILRDLGVVRMQLLGSPRRMPSMTGYGLEVAGFMPPNA
ncbi:MAG: bifunctional 3,4-dihydroxy-2-butanone-4-phosphate synthase/GTP cyclohydrolase II, partial [Rubrivivax sp.]|nr:bifunctional 3,4-dihydroxy-2-butanone-4-phosphate synthase/GTP cyclohydrolase II [Rubrivivax sp.]